MAFLDTISLNSQTWQLVTRMIEIYQDEGKELSRICFLNIWKQLEIMHSYLQIFVIIFYIINSNISKKRLVTEHKR